MATAQSKVIEGTSNDANGFPENYVNKIFIDTNPTIDNQGDVDLDDVSTGKWAWLAGGINTATPSSNETTSNDSYYDDGGTNDSDVTGKNIQIALSGNRKVGNPAQDFVGGRFFLKGNKVKTRIIWIMNGLPILSQATLTNIVPLGGAANAKETFSFTIALDKQPRIFNGQLTLSETETKTVYTANVDTTKTADDDGQPLKAIVKDTADTGASSSTNQSHNA